MDKKYIWILISGLHQCSKESTKLWKKNLCIDSFYEVIKNKAIIICLIPYFEESQPKILELRNNPENVHLCLTETYLLETKGKCIS